MEYIDILSLLMAAPVLIKVLFSLAGILIVNNITKNLVISVLLGTLILAFWSGHDISAIGTICYNRLTSMNLIFLLIIIVQVIVFSSQMSETGVMKELVQMVQSRATKRLSVALLPAVIGLLPMPGGALFSAPLVDDCDSEKVVEPVLKTRINYWFRHVWEYWWPVYPGVLLAIEITRLPMWQFILLQLPLSILSIIAGYIFFLRKVENTTFSFQDNKQFKIIEFIKISLPIIIITFTIILRVFVPSFALLNKYIPLIIGILVAMIIHQFMKPLGLKSWKKMILSKRILSLMILVAAIRIYGAFVEAELPGGVLLVEMMRMELDSIGIPLIAIIMLIPFIAGMSSGLAIGFVGAAFPIVISILGPEPHIGVLLATTLLAFASGYMGMMLSPVHVCFVVTNEYFKTRLVNSLGGLLKPAFVILIGAIGLYLLIRFVLFPGPGF